MVLACVADLMSSRSSVTAAALTLNRHIHPVQESFQSCQNLGQ